MKKILIFSRIFVSLLLLAFLFASCEPKLSNEARKKFAEPFKTDSLLSPERNFGNVNLLKFKALLASSGVVDTAADVVRKNDSIYFSIATAKQSRMYFGFGDGSDEGEKWTEKFRNLPIGIVAHKHISAKVVQKEGKEYVYIPYEMLSCVVAFVGERPNSKLVIKANENENDMQARITFRDTNEVNRRAAGGQKIQTEGYVLKNVSDILTSHDCGHADQARQMRVLYDYVHTNWTYIYDPAVGEDTWRSATETIENYYFTANHKYTGDCDDFAILMASFARQIGYQSRFVAEWGGGGGHAHAEYSSDGTHWFSLDWDGSACRPISMRSRPYPNYRYYYDL